jgi:MarR family 2-MHQ and catechol resistance regulon transcriptional repressor
MFRSEAKMANTRELTLKLWVVLSRAQAAIEAHARADVARHDLTLAEFGVLEAILHRGPMLLGEAQKEILVSSGGITYLVDRLEKKGLVERRECPSDRRARYAALTPEGEALIQRIFLEHARVLEDALSGLDEEEKQETILLLRKLGERAAELERESAAA